MMKDYRLIESEDITLEDIEKETKTLMINYNRYANKRIRCATEKIQADQKTGSDELHSINAIMMGYNHIASVLEKLEMMKKGEFERAIARAELSVATDPLG